MYRGLDSQLTLSDLKENQRFRIIRIHAPGEIRRRLVDMGFISGTEGILLRMALFRDPIEIFLKGSRISVRRAEANQIAVEPIE
jgi:Fe2+ transport system protein FeoA